MNNDDDYIEAVASIVAQNIRETEIKIMYDCLKECNLLDEFYKFCKTRPDLLIFDAVKAFAKLHPDKLYCDPLI